MSANGHALDLIRVPPGQRCPVMRLDNKVGATNL